MFAYNIYIFNRQGTCLYYYEWHRPKSVRQGAGTPADDQKMMFGLFFSLKTFAAAMDPRQDNKVLGAPLRIGEACTFHAFRTNNYKLHFLESPSGLKIVLNTGQEAGDMRDHLNYIYGAIYVECVLKNPAYTPGRPFSCELFTARLLQYIRSLGL